MSTENEVRTITAISGSTITLNSALAYNHEGVDREVTVETGNLNIEFNPINFVLTYI